MLTVRDAEDDKIEALEAGADDYITKPFRIRELTARVRTAVRQHRALESPSELPIVIGYLTLDPVRRSVERSGSKIHLTPHEFDALRLLMSQAGRPVTHARLHAMLRGSDSAVDRESLRVVIAQLRKKLEEDVRNPRYLLTDSYIGYRFRAP
jgi:two-component system, OmpR family, KDP operon response regulator KdpE